MRTASYTVRTITPTFLGNARQEAQWRTPPIKALLRQWWRVAYAAERNFAVDVLEMRHEEGLLFGHAWLEDDTVNRNGCAEKTAGRKSQVRLRLDSLPMSGTGRNPDTGWALGSHQGVTPLPKGQDTSYAWFGIVKRGDLPDRIGISPDLESESTRVLRLAAPEHLIPRLQEVMALIQAFGLLGSRSRGGWGALHIKDVEDMSASRMKHYARPLDECLQDDWAMSLATYGAQIAVWHSKESFKTWDGAMRFIATERKHIRTSLKAVHGKDLRSALGFATPGRMPSPLRWKVVPAPDGSAMRVRIFAMPHRIPDEGGQRFGHSDLRTAWNTVFDTLQNMQNLIRITA